MIVKGPLLGSLGCTRLDLDQGLFFPAFLTICTLEITPTITFFQTGLQIGANDFSEGTTTIETLLESFSNYNIPVDVRVAKSIHSY